MSTYWAVLDAQRDVLRYVTADTADHEPAADGQTWVALASRGVWPAAPHAGAVLTMDQAGTTHWRDTRDLAQIKADVWRAIKAAREAHEFGGFAWGGSAFDSDAMSQSRIVGASVLAMQALSAQQPFSIDWTLADNTVRTLSATEIIAAGQALALHVETQHATARVLRAAIEAATTPEQLDAIAWP